MNKQILLRKIIQEFPDLKWKHAQHNVEGWDHYVLILDNKYVFRFPRKNNYAKKLYHEVLLLKYLQGKKLSIPMPNYEFVARDKSFAGYSILEGFQMTKEYFSKIPDKSRSVIAKQLASFLSFFHRVPLSVAKKYQAESPDSRKQFTKLVKNVEKYIKPRISKRENVLIDEFFKEFAKYQHYPTKCFIHADIHPYHLLVQKDKKKLSGLIDFADRSIGDPAMDFAELWTFGRKFIEEVYKNYKGPKDKDFLHRSQLYCKRVPLWMMMSPSLGMRGTFKDGYRVFKYVYLQNLFE